MPIKLTLTWVSKELGLPALRSAGPNAWILCAQRSLRMFGFGLTNLVLALFFHELGFQDNEIGFFFTCTLWGDVLLSLLLTLVADGLGRRRILMAGSVLMTISGVTFAVAENYFILLAAAILGVISVSGSEIGPFRAIEESVLAHLTGPDDRTYVLTYYVVTAAVGTAWGVGFCGFLVDYLQARPAWTVVDSYHAVFWVYAGIGVINALLSYLLTEQCELVVKPKPKSTTPSSTEVDDAVEMEGLLGSDDGEETAETSPAKATPEPKKSYSLLPQISQESRLILFKLCLIMGMDSFASGMVPFSLINYYMDCKFHLPKKELGSIMSITWAFSAVSNMFAGPIAKRIGLVKTMVCTHLPSAVFLALLPVPQSLGFTIALLFLRSSLSSMDQAPRSAFIAAIVKPEERTAVMGVVNVCKTLAQSAGPYTTGWLARGDMFWVAFVSAGSLKAAYDLLLLSMFLNIQLSKHEPTTERRLAQDDASERSTP